MREAEARGKTTTREDDARARSSDRFVQRFELTRALPFRSHHFRRKFSCACASLFQLAIDLLAFSDLCTISLLGESKRHSSVQVGDRDKWMTRMK